MYQYASVKAINGIHKSSTLKYKLNGNHFEADEQKYMLYQQWFKIASVLTFNLFVFIIHKFKLQIYLKKIEIYFYT